MDEGTFWGLVGILASVTVVISFLPQIVRILTTRRADDLSMGLPLLLILGSILWASYGIHLKDVIIVTVNIAVFSFNILLLLLKRRYSGARAQVLPEDAAEEGR